jgi:hypothetical protein
MSSEITPGKYDCLRMSSGVGVTGPGKGQIQKDVVSDALVLARETRDDCRGYNNGTPCPPNCPIEQLIKDAESVLLD